VGKEAKSKNLLPFPVVHYSNFELPVLPVLYRYICTASLRHWEDHRWSVPVSVCADGTHCTHKCTHSATAVNGCKIYGNSALQG
jgi:hypothetical protein